MTKRPLGIQSPWDIPAAVLTVLLSVNFLALLVLSVAVIGVIFLEPLPAVLTAVLLLLGILCHLITRHKTGKLWRRLLLGGIAANFLIVAFYVLVVAMMVLAWQ